MRLVGVAGLVLAAACGGHAAAPDASPAADASPPTQAPLNGNPAAAGPSIRLVAFAKATTSPQLPTICQSDYGSLETAIAARIGVAMTASP
jgi:hypothetical protein